MNIEILLSDEFKIYSMNYALVQKKPLEAIPHDEIIKQWEIFQTFKKNREELNKNNII